MEPIVTAEVLRRMVQERIQMYESGRLSEPELRGYIIAMFHAGALSSGECYEILSTLGLRFALTSPSSDAAPQGEPPSPPANGDHHGDLSRAETGLLRIMGDMMVERKLPFTLTPAPAPPADTESPTKTRSDD